MTITRNLIAETFKTDHLTTHRVLQNCNWGFFASHFEDAELKWELAHIHDGKLEYYKGVNIDFVKLHFELFATRCFWTSAGWGPLREDGRVHWEYHSGFRIVEIGYED